MHFEQVTPWKVYTSDGNIPWKKEISIGRETKMIKGATKEEVKEKEERPLAWFLSKSVLC